MKYLDGETLRAHLAAIVDSSDDAILSKSLDGIVLSWNPAAERLYGYRPDEIVGKSIATLVPDDRAGEVDKILERIRQGRAVEHFETVRVHKNGTRIPVSLTISPIRDAAGNIAGASTIARDISERKRLERELQEARDQALEASRLKSDFLATMSHEIRTPMNGVIGMTGVLLDTELDPQQRQYAETVRRSGEGLLTIINDILDFSKIEAGKLDLEILDFDLRTVVEEVADLLAEQAHSKGLELVTRLRPAVPRAVRGDPGRVRQVLTNLVGNAIKFTETGEVVVDADVAEEGPEEVLVRFNVTDTGIGIAPNLLPRLFTPFSQADSSTTRTHGGTGLGLAISKQLVEMMGGTIEVDSQPGEGSTFTFTVRLAKRSERAPKERAARHLHGLRVLVVDDNRTNREILEHQVASWGMSSATAPDADSALALLREAAATGRPFDIALLDMEMPGTDGLALAEAIRADRLIGALPLVLLTSSGVRGSAESARDAGFAAYLTKPVRQSHLYDCVATVIGAGVPVPPRLITRQTLTQARAESRPRVLVAEDNQVNQKVAAAMLAKLGYRTDIVANGAEAVEALSRIPYGAVLMDCQMPEMDGYEATLEIRNAERGKTRTPIIAMTAAAMAGEREKCLAVGMDDYVSKPVKLDELSSVLARWVPSNAADPADGQGADDVDVPGEPPTLDPQIVLQLRALGEDHGSDLFTRMAELFLTESARRLEVLQTAIAQGDVATLKQEVHALKGVSGTLGAARVAYRCRELEEAIASGEADLDPAALDPLREDLAAVKSAFSALGGAAGA
ncbi:MAG: response regulator [Actinomycetota bacterium]|nr:response regulator [Actinomycetota bacterium]